MNSTETHWVRLVLASAGAAAVGVGFLGIAFGSLWAAEALEFFDSHPVGRALELSVPFLPILLITSGAFLLVKSRR